MAKNEVSRGSARLDRRDGQPVAVLAGEIDVTVADPITDDAIAAHCRGNALTVDLREVTFLDSFGLSLLVRFRQFADPVRLVGASDDVARLIAMTGLTSVFDT